MGPHDFSRPLHMLLGLPFDAVRMTDVVAAMQSLPARDDRWFVSTPNLNFLMVARTDTAFRQSVLDSDMSLADGMPIIWIARLLGVPLPERVPGSGLIETLRKAPAGGAPLKVFFFGGEPGLAERAHARLNAESRGLVSVGAIDPGYGTVEALSDPAYIAQINAARPDLLIVALGAKKGQAWIVANRAALDVRAVSHLGAVIKFVAGEVTRAPEPYQRLGLEWLWRIREEPGLWRRYAGDAARLLAILMTCVLPLAVVNRLAGRAPGAIDMRQAGRGRIILGGRLGRQNLDEIRDAFRAIAGANAPIELDFGAVRHVDSAFLGQLCLLRAEARSRGVQLRLCHLPRRIRRIFRWSLCNYLLEPGTAADQSACRAVGASAAQRQ